MLSESLCIYVEVKAIRIAWFLCLIVLDALRILWLRHRHPTMIFPNARGSLETIQKATTHMNVGGTQKAMKTVVSDCNIKKKSPFIPCVTPMQLICLNAV